MWQLIMNSCKIIQANGLRYLIKLSTANLYVQFHNFNAQSSFAYLLVPVKNRNASAYGSSTVATLILWNLYNLYSFYTYLFFNILLTKLWQHQKNITARTKVDNALKDVGQSFKKHICLLNLLASQFAHFVGAAILNFCFYRLPIWIVPPTL